MLWIFLTILAALLQSIRNALQSKLSKELTTLSVTFSRFIFALPVVATYLVFLYYFKPNEKPVFNFVFYILGFSAACLQIIATALMVILFKQKNFAIGVGLAKSEALIAAILGTLFFGSFLSFIGWIGVCIGAVAVFILANIKLRNFDLTSAIIGLASGGCFALTSLFIREASLSLDISPLLSAAWSLAYVLSIQTLLFFFYIALKAKDTLTQIRERTLPIFFVSLSGATASICWCTAFTLDYVAYVKTLGQIEIIFSLILGIFFLKQTYQRNTYTGLILTVIATILVILPH